MSKHALTNLRDIFPTAEDFYLPWNDWFQKHVFHGGVNIPALNVSESKEDYTVTLAAPGLKKEDFDISLDHNILSVSVSAEKEEEQKKEKFTRKEYNYTHFSRSFTLPLHIDTEGIEAYYDNGILKLIFHKLRDGKTESERKITIN